MDPRRPVLVLALLLATPCLFAQLSFDNFDSYVAGDFIAGMGDWETWDNNPLVDAQVSDLFANSLPNSLALEPDDDIVRIFNGINQGSFTLTSNVFVPSGQAGQYYYILLNTYDGSGVGYNWSAQILMSDLTGLVSDVGGSSGFTGTSTPQAIIYDTWVTVAVEVDLTTNTYSAFYGGVPIMTGSTWAGGAGVPRLQAIDLYNAGGGIFYYDDVSLDCTGGCGGCLPFDTMTCSIDCVLDEVTLDWTTFQVGGYGAGITVNRNGVPIASLLGTDTGYVDTAPDPGLNSYEVVGDCGAQTWSVTCDIQCPSANDECINAELVNEGVFTFDNSVTPITGPIDCDANMSTDLWYLYTATVDGDCNIQTCDTTGTLTDTTLIVYDATLGCPVTPSVCLASDDDGCGPIGFSSEVTIPVTVGQELYVQVGGWNGSTGTATLTIEIVEVLCSDGIDNDLDGLIDCDDPNCAADPNCFEFNCADGIDDDNDGDIDCFDADCVGTPTCLEQGNCADGFDNDLDGDIDCADTDCALDIACVPVAPNDECINAIAVTLGDTGFNNINTPLTGPIDCDANMTNDVWFEFSAPAAGSYSINTCGTLGTLTDTTLIVYDGAACPVAPDPGIACDDDSCGVSGVFNSEVVVTLAVGESVLIQVGGWNGTTGDGTLTIAQVVSAPTAVTCTDTGVDVNVTWTDAVGGPGADSYNIYLNGVFQANQAFGATSFNTPYPAGGAGVVTVCVETVFGVDVSVQSCCSISIGGPPNDECATAIVAALGDTLFSNIASTSNGPIDCDINMTTDVWYSHTVANDGALTISTCNTVGTLTDTTLIVYDGAAGCPIAPALCLASDDDSCGPTGFNSTVTVNVIAGDELLIQVGGWNGTVGDATLTIEQDCGDLGVATCVVNGAGDVDITWVDNANATLGYEIFENGVSVGTAPAGSSSFTVVGPAGGLNTYDVTWTCVLGGGPGTGASCSLTIVAPIPPGTTDVILHNEDTALGLVDSGLALETALNNAGRNVYRVNSPDFDLSGLDLSGVDTIWCCFGTFPNDYRISQGEGDLLATLNAAGIGIYFEGGDHWGFAHTVSLLDDRDGVGTALDGDDTFLSMDPFAGGAVDLSALGTAIPYTQDAAGNDWTDQLTVAAADLDVTLAQEVWTQAGGGYITAVYAEHATGENMLGQSWEFGGFGGDQDALASEYLALLGRGGPPVQQFIRADANRDGGVNIADAIFILGVLFPGAGGANVLSCVDAGDCNDDGTVNIADAIFLLGNLFPGAGGAPGIPAPNPACGADPTADALDCATYTCP